MATEADVVAFFAGWTGCPADNIDPGDLLGSTGWDGDDAFELIEGFGEAFGVDLSGYVWEFHHNDEGTLLSPHPFIRSPHQRVQRIPLTAAMLAGFTKSGEWHLDYPAYRPRPRYDIWFSPVHIVVALMVALLLLGGLS